MSCVARQYFGNTNNRSDPITKCKLHAAALPLLLVSRMYLHCLWSNYGEWRPWKKIIIDGL